MTRVATELAAGAPFLQEVRLDALAQPLDDALALVRRHAARLVVCCRPSRQGGAFSGSEAERLALLGQAARAGVAYLDVEDDCDDTQIAALRRATSGALVLSWHDFDGCPGDVRSRIEAMAARGADVAKLAVTVGDAAELAPLRRATQGLTLPTVIIGMGYAGLLSRCRYPAFGAPWTYVKVDDDVGTAPGQLSLAEARRFGLPDSARAPFWALVGGAQIAHSRGPWVYNGLFRARGLSYSYLPVLTDEPRATFELLRDLGGRGASVTMPHKAAALAFGAPDDVAQRVGAANSLRFVDDRAESTNTDVAGVAGPLAGALERVESAPRSALVLGGGGAARAATVACRQLGLRVIVSARRPEALSWTAELEEGEGVDAAPWDARHRVEAEVLINATPVSGSTSPWPAGKGLHKAIVFDLAITGGPSALLSQAEAEGARALTAQMMWLAQGARQLSWLTGEPCTVAQLEEQRP